MDGSTDEGCVEQETLFVKVCNQGNMDTKFLCIGEPSSTCATDLHAFVWDNLNKLSLDLYKMVGFGCDGAANMVKIINNNRK